MEFTVDQKKAAIEARREYNRKWRSQNKDKVKEYNESYWLRKAKELQESANREE